MRPLRSLVPGSQLAEQSHAAAALSGPGRALQQGPSFNDQPPDLSASGGVTIIAVLGGCLAAVVLLGVVCVFLRRRCWQQRRVADAEADATATGGGAGEGDAGDDAKPKAMDRARSAYLIEGPDGELACGVRISSFMVLRQKTASMELPELLPGTLPETGKGLDQQCDDSSAGPSEACSASTSGELAAVQASPADADRQPLASLSDSSSSSSGSGGSSSSWNTAAEARSQAARESLDDMEAAVVAATSRQQHDCQPQQPVSSEQPGSEGAAAATSAADGHAAAQPPEASADQPLTLRQRFSFGLFRPPPQQQDAALQNV